MSASAEMKVRLERHIKAPASRVWGIISSLEGMQQWLGPKTYEPHPGGRILFDVQHGDKRWIMFGRIERFEPDIALAFGWHEVDTGALTMWPAQTLVTIALAPRDGGTLVTLTHSGFEALPDGSEQRDGYQEGWDSLNDLDALARMCEGA